MKKLFAASLLGLTTLLSACSTQTAYINDNVPSNANPTHVISQPFFIFGIGQTERLNASQYCHSQEKVGKVESKLTGKNILLGIVTLGIYTPRTAHIYCK